MNSHPPHWRPAHEPKQAETPPPALRQWLLDAGSLTGKLRARYGAGLVITPLEESWIQVGAEEASALGVAVSERVRLRRVRLADGGISLVFARTLIPQRTLEGDGARLMHLGGRALGELVFNEFDATRSPFELAYLEPHRSLFPELLDPVWARRSVLTTPTGPVLVTEALLPALLDEPHAQNTNARA